MTSIVLELDGVSKDYHALRPLRIERLRVAAGEQIAIMGIDPVASEVLIGLMTGAMLPDKGCVLAFGRATSDISDSTDWLAAVDRFGIVSERAVLLDGLDVLQNLAVPFTLDIDPLAADARDRACILADEVGLVQSVWHQRVAVLSPSSRARVRVARALALDPAVLLMEHPSAGLTSDEASALGSEARAVAGRRHMAVVALTSDGSFARAVAGRVLQFEAATGRLTERGRALG